MKKAAAVIFIVVVVCLAVTIGNLKTYKYEDGDQYTVGGARISDEVKELVINWVDGKVEIVPYNGDEIVLSEQASQKLSQKKQLHWLLDGKTLQVQYAGSGSFRISDLKKVLTVKIPESLLLDDANIIVVSAEAEIDGLKAEKLKIVTVSGAVKAVCERVSKVDAVTVSGDLVLQFEKAPEKVEAESVSGGVSISLPEAAGFKAEMDSVSGSVKSSFSVERRGEDEYVYSDGSCEIDVNTVSGDLTLEQLK